MSVLVGWILGLAPAILIRYVFVRRAVETGAALGILAVQWLITVVGLASADIPVNHGALFILLLVAYWILRSGVRDDPKAKLELTSAGNTPQQVRSETGVTAASVEQSQAAISKSGDEGMYLRVTNEFEKGAKNDALWAKALALSDGDIETAKYKYINFRVQSLKAEEEMLARLNHDIPVELKQMLSQKELLSEFAGRPRYQQKGYLKWIKRAANQTEKTNRIDAVVSEMETPNQYMGQRLGQS